MRSAKGAWVAVLFMASAGIAQTTVTTGGGTASSIPVFNGGSSIGNSVISQSNGNVLIGAPISAGGNAAQWGTGASSISGNFNQTNEQGIGLVLEGISTGQSAATATGSLMQFQQDYVYTWSVGMLPTQSRYSFIQGRGVGGGTGTEVMTLNGTSVGIGTPNPQASLDVNGNVRISGSGAGLTFPDGSVQATAYTGTCTAGGGDYAESVDVTGEKSSYEPGDVMVLDPNHLGHFLRSSEPYSTMVAGIYSTKPGYVGRRQQVNPKLATGEVPMAMVGIVPTKVSAENGPIHVGDLLVTSSLPGYVMKGTDHNRMIGSVVGKAMGVLESGTGAIEVLVSLQ